MTREPKKTFYFYVNRFEVLASELRDLAGQAKSGELAQMLAPHLLGAHIANLTYLQLHKNRNIFKKESAAKKLAASEELQLARLEKIIEKLKEADIDTLQSEL